MSARRAEQAAIKHSQRSRSVVVFLTRLCGGLLSLTGARHWPTFPAANRVWRLTNLETFWTNQRGRKVGLGHVTCENTYVTSYSWTRSGSCTGYLWSQKVTAVAPKHQISTCFTTGGAVICVYSAQHGRDSHTVTKQVCLYFKASHVDHI